MKRNCSSSICQGQSKGSQWPFRGAPILRTSPFGVALCVFVPSVQHTSKSRPLDQSQETALPPPPGIIRGSDPLINTNKHSPPSSYSSIHLPLHLPILRPSPGSGSLMWRPEWRMFLGRWGRVLLTRWLMMSGTGRQHAGWWWWWWRDLENCSAVPLTYVVLVVVFRSQAHCRSYFLLYEWARGGFLDL